MITSYPVQESTFDRVFADGWIKFISIIALFVLVLAQLWHPRVAVAHQSAQSTPPNSRWAVIDAYVETRMRDLHIPGLALGIVQGDQVVHLKGFGIADSSGRAVTPQTPFLIGSNAKSMTAMAVMQLVEAGKIDLDHSVQRYLPWFEVADAGAAGTITVRQLLTHTSGLPNMAGSEHFLDGADYVGVLVDRVQALRAVRLNRAPGERYEYANMNYVILAVVIETVSGQPFARYIEQHIFVPLGMEHSYLSQTQARANGAARGYQQMFGRPVPSDQPFIHGALGAGWVYASAEDMARYLGAHLNAGHISESNVVSSEGIQMLLRPTADQGGGERFYALGWEVWSDAGVRVVGHNGGTSDFTALQVLIPDHRLGFVVLMNTWTVPHISRVTAMSADITALLLDREPTPLSVDPLPFILYGVPVGVMCLGLLVTILTARALRHSSLDNRRASRDARRRLAHLGRIAIFHVVWGVVPVLMLTRLTGFPLPILRVYIPDVGWLILASVVLGLAHALICGLLALRALHHSRLPRVTPTRLEQGR